MKGSPWRLSCGIILRATLELRRGIAKNKKSAICRSHGADSRKMVEQMGVEPTTYTMRTYRSSQLSYCPTKRYQLIYTVTGKNQGGFLFFSKKAARIPFLKEWTHCPPWRSAVRRPPDKKKTHVRPFVAASGGKRETFKRAILMENLNAARLITRGEEIRTRLPADNVDGNADAEVSPTAKLVQQTCTGQKKWRF